MRAPSRVSRAVFAVFAVVALVFAVLGGQRPAPADSQTTLPDYRTLTPVRILGYVRRVYREHRPPPPYETYTLIRKDWMDYGGPDLASTYTKHYWVRTSDDAALRRFAYRDDYDGRLVFTRPAVNQDRDPGPPTADLFAPAIKHPVTFVPTPEPSAQPLKVIGAIVAFSEPDYNVPKMTVEGDQLHLWLQPKRDPERNVLRQIWVDKHTYMLMRVIAHDRMFIPSLGHVYPMSVTYSLGYLQGYVVITHIDGKVLPVTDADYSYEGDTGDKPYLTIDFTDITFPKSLPAWYFDPSTYAQHVNDAPI